MNISKIIRDSAKAQINQIHTAFPAKIVAVEGFDIDVKPTIMVKQGNGYRELPVIPSVPFLCPSSGNKRGIYFLPKIGDDVLILCTEDNYENWISTGVSSPALDGRKFSLSDAVAIMGFQSEIDRKLDVLPDEVVVTSNMSSVKLKDDGRVIINDSVTNAVSFQELKAGFDLLVTHVQAIGVLAGYANPIPVSATNIDKAISEKVFL